MSETKTLHQYPQLVNAVFNQPWAILPEKLEMIADILRRYIVGESGSPIEAQTEHVSRSENGGTVAVIPVFGMMAQRMNLMAAASGGVSTEWIGEQIDRYGSDNTVKTIILDIDSPGGEVFGLEELANKIMALREKKRVVAVANPWAASGAYYLASAASEIVVTPSGQVGSVGVVAIHTDVSEMQKQSGVQSSLIYAGKYKVETSQLAPLSDEARAGIQENVDRYYDMFVSTVARGRGIGKASVRSNYGQGRMIMAKEAVKAGMADRIATLDETIEKYRPMRAQGRGVNLLKKKLDIQRQRP